MARDRLFANPEAEDDVVADGLAARESELDSYELNIANYERQLESMKDLPAEWPSEIAGLKGARSDQLVERLSGDALTLATKLAHRDYLKMLLETSRIECAKSQAAYDALRVHLPFERLAAAVARKKDRDAKKAAGQ